MQTEKRAYPRIQPDWPLYLSDKDTRRSIGYVRDISLSGALLFFSEEYELEPGKHRFTLKLKNDQLEPPELEIKGLKEWETRDKNEIFVGIALDDLKREKRSPLMHYLSRSDSIQVQAFLIETT